MNRVEQLTFTRFLAVMVVLFFHGGGGIYLAALAKIYPLASLLTSAMSAVTYLYILSGFVMVLAHYRPGEKFSFNAYWKARLIRLYPLYILAFLLTCHYYGLTVTTTGFKDALANVFIAQAWIPKYAQSFNFPAWSITVEIFFYAVFPVLTIWAARQPTRNLIWFSALFWALTQFIHNALWIGFFPEWIDFLIYFPVFHLSSFVLGVAGGIWFLREGRAQNINPRVNLAFLAVGVLLAGAYVVISSTNAKIPHEGQLMTGFLAPFLTLPVLALALDRTRLSAFLQHPVLVALGEISYAVYIFHIPVKWLYERALENTAFANQRALFDYTYLPLMIALGFAVTFYVDQPLRVWLKKILRPVNLPLFFIDLGSLSYALYLIFLFRFDTLRRHDDHYTAFLLAFWTSFALRAISSLIFKNFSPDVAYDSFIKFARPVFAAVTVGSSGIAAVVYVGYRIAWIEYFPLSVLALDWASALTLSLLTRYLFRLAKLRFSAPVEA